MTLDDRILSLIDGRESLDSVAVAVFRHQWEHCAPYRRLCDARKINVLAVERAVDVPAIPIEAFRAVDLRTFPAERTVATFRSSGTTEVERSTHHFDTLDLYRHAALGGFRAALCLDRPRRIVSLIPGAEERPDSSLSRMVTWAIAEFGSPGSCVDPTLESVPGSGEPILLLGTAFGLATLFEAQPTRVLPPGSSVMETGGFKGQRKELSRTELFALYARAGVEPRDVVGEYGMAELSSQWYDARVGEGGPADDRVYRPPPWALTRVVDPESGADVEYGQPGLLLHVDPANRGSVQAILTQDVGRRVPHDPSEVPAGPPRDGFVYLGRASDALLKGCGLVDET